MKYLIIPFLALATISFSQSSSDLISGKTLPKTEKPSQSFSPKEKSSKRIVLYALPQTDTIKVVNSVFLEVNVIEYYYEVTSPTGETGKLPTAVPAKVFFTDEKNKTIQLDEKRILALYPCTYCD